MKITNNNHYSGTNYQFIDSIKKNNNNKKLECLYTEKAKYESQLNSWDNIEASLKNLYFVAIRLENATAESLPPTLNAFVEAYNKFRDTRDSEVNGALRSSDTLSRIEHQLQNTVIKLRNLDTGITLEKGKLLINDAKLDKAVTDNPKAIIDFLNGDGTGSGTNPNFKISLYQALDNALRKRGPGIIEGMIAGARFTAENQLKHIERNIQITGNLIATQQTTTGNSWTHHQAQNEIQKIRLDIINTFFDKK